MTNLREQGIGGQPQDPVPQEEQSTPEQRTIALFAYDYRELMGLMVGRIIVNEALGTGWVISEVVPYSRAQNSTNWKYRPLAEGQIPAGQLWGCVDPRPKGSTIYALISARDGNIPVEAGVRTEDAPIRQRGACLKINKISRYDPNTRKTVVLTSKRQIAEALGLGPAQRMNLRFKNASEILYLEPVQEQPVEGDQQSPLSPQKSRDIADAIFKEE